MTTRRALLGGGVALAMVPTGWARAFARDAVQGASPYGELGAPDALGIRLPAGFSARRIGVSGRPVAGRGGFAWHMAPDGGATFAMDDGGWVYVSNCEMPKGGASAVRFDSAGEIVDAYSILSGTRVNCAGGRTPWGTWLSCEEIGFGRVWECDPSKPGQGIERPALGRFSHEAAAVDPATGYVYLTEDEGDSRLYRFRPTRAADLSAGMLEAAFVAESGQVSWVRVSPNRKYRGEDTTAFVRGEGAWFEHGLLYFCTTGDDRVWSLNPRTDVLSLVYDAAQYGDAANLREPDNVTVHAQSGDIFVAEDADDLQLVLLTNSNAERIQAPFLQLVGHDDSEVTGPAFSPDGSRLYFSSQRGTGGKSLSPGMTYEIRGPFRGV